MHVSKQLQPIWRKKKQFSISQREIKKRRESIIEYLPFDQVSHNLGMVFFHFRIENYVWFHWICCLSHLRSSSFRAADIFSPVVVSSQWNPIVSITYSIVYLIVITLKSTSPKRFFPSSFPIHLFFHRSSLTLPFVIFSMALNWNQLLVVNSNLPKTSIWIWF